MKAQISRFILQCLENDTPGLMKRIQLQILLDLTARAFHVRKKRIWQYPSARAVREYALFTGDCMEHRHADPRSLYQEAYRTGSKLRRLTGFTESEDLERLVFLLYRNIQITMKGQIPGIITVNSCFFSRFYTPEQCRLMSFLDAGIIAGIYGSGTLEFTERITEGYGKCRACFKEGDDNEQHTS